jgi:hypothetical protein
MKMNLDVPLRWIRRREDIREEKEAGKPWPWTDDPILRDYSFCNVRREHDKVTKWIATNFRTPNADDPNLWFAMTVARFVNKPETLARLGYPTNGWDREHFKRTLRAINGSAFGAAYVIPNGGAKKPKIDYVADDILHPLWKGREHLVPKPGISLQTYCDRLTQFNGVGGFYAGQIIADLKYVEPMRSARDWMTFAVSGPGSENGLNRVFGREPKRKWSNSDWQNAFRRFEAAIRPELEHIGLGDLHGQDLQNCLCEISKYWRALNGEGRPKRRYSPPAPPLADAAE